VKDALPTLTTQQDEVIENEIEYDYYREKKKIQKGKCIDLKRDYVPKLATILTISLILWFILGTIVYFTPYYDVFGWYIVCSKGWSLAIMFTMSFLMFFISHDIMTWARRKWKYSISGWLDHYFMIHKFWGYLLTFYSIIHSLCHLTGSFRIIAQSNDISKINKDKGGKDFDETPTYFELLFTTIPGVTGIVLLLIIIIMAITSTKWIRMKYFQLFGYTHMLLFPIFWTTLIFHGFGFWFTMGVPFAIFIVTPGFIILLVQQFMRIFTHKINPFQIIDISASNDWTYMLMYLQKPKNYRLIHGQYVFLNVPCIHPLQWHPFTVASSPHNPYLTLMIKKAGDWTGRLICHLYERKKRMMKMNELEFENWSEYDLFNCLHDLHQELLFRDVKERNKLFYPKVKISLACSTPNDTFIDKKNIIMVGAGSGISPYLCLLEDVIRDDKGKKNEFNFDSAKLIFIARAGEQISWISNYLFHIINSPWMIPKLEFYIFLTLEKNLKTLPCFLFWRAFLLISLSKQICSRKRKSFLPTLKYDSTNTFINKEEFHHSPIKVLFGRPNFESLFKSSITKKKETIYVYSTSSAQINQKLFDTCWKLTKETDATFKHIYEATS